MAQPQLLRGRLAAVQRITRERAVVTAQPERTVSMGYTVPAAEAAEQAGVVREQAAVVRVAFVAAGQEDSSSLLVRLVGQDALS